MVIAGLRFDTRGDPLGVSGPRWKLAAPEARILPMFAARHPSGDRGLGHVLVGYGQPAKEFKRLPG
jgi:hypothetical protein